MPVRLELIITGTFLGSSPTSADLVFQNKLLVHSVVRSD